MGSLSDPRVLSAEPIAVRFSAAGLAVPAGIPDPSTALRTINRRSSPMASVGTSRGAPASLRHRTWPSRKTGAQKEN
jgi:hypothetical protein